MTRKSSPLTRHYRPGASRGPVVLATFREQMADYARAEYLRELRDARHLSREKVASEIGVTTKTLYEWENGGKIKWENAVKLANFYGVDPESIVTRDLTPADLQPATHITQLDRMELELAGVRKELAALTEVFRQMQVEMGRLTVEASPGATDKGKTGIAPKSSAKKSRRANGQDRA